MSGKQRIQQSEDLIGTSRFKAAFHSAVRRIIAAILLITAQEMSVGLAQTYVWEGNQNGDGPFIYDPPTGDPYPYFYPVSDAWTAGAQSTPGLPFIPSNWSRADFPNSPSAMVVIPVRVLGKTYPPRLGDEVSVGTVSVNEGAHLKLGGRLNISDALTNSGLIDLMNSGYVNGGRISNGSTGILRAANSTLHGLVQNDGKIELVPLSLPLLFDDAEYSGTGIIEGDSAGTSVAGKVTVVGGEMTFRNGKISVGTATAVIDLINDASVGFDDVDASIRTLVTNRGMFRVGDGATLAIGATINNAGGIVSIGSGGIAKLGQGGVVNGGTINGILRLVGEGTLTGHIINNGELRFLEGNYNHMQDAHISGGQISGDTIGIANGTLTTEGVTFRNGTFHLGSAGFGPINWTIAGTDTVTDIDLRLTGQATNNGRLIVAAGGIFRSGNFDNTNGVIEVQEGGEFRQGQGELRGGTINGILQLVGGGTLTGHIINNGELRFLEPNYNHMQDAHISGGQISGDTIGIANGTLTTEGVTFRNGTFHLGSAGFGPINWTIAGTDTVTDIDLRLTGQATNNGRLIVAAGGIFRSGNFNNTNGIIEVQAGGVFYAQNLANGEGAIHVDGDFYANGVLDLQEGELRGTGYVYGNVVNSSGTVAPGASPGALHINGNFQQLPTGLLTMEIGGTMPGTEYDQFLVTGNLLLEGSVQVSFINGFVPQLGDTFNLFSGSTINLTSPLSFLNTPPAFNYTSTVNNGVFSITVTAVPEPSTAILFAAATLGLAVRRGHRSRTVKLSASNK